MYVMEFPQVEINFICVKCKVETKKLADNCECSKKPGEKDSNGNTKEDLEYLERKRKIKERQALIRLMHADHELNNREVVDENGRQYLISAATRVNTIANANDNINQIVRLRDGIERIRNRTRYVIRNSNQIQMSLSRDIDNDMEDDEDLEDQEFDYILT